MGMVCYLRAAGDDEIENLLKHPELVQRLLDDRTGDILELEQNWHGIHYLLTGNVTDTSLPLGFLLASGQQLNIDSGNSPGPLPENYVPPRAFSAEEVAAVDLALSKLTEKEFRNRFDAEAMMHQQVYPAKWTPAEKAEDDEEEPLEVLAEYFGDLKTFIRECKAGYLGMVIWQRY